MPRLIAVLGLGLFAVIAQAQQLPATDKPQQATPAATTQSAGQSTGTQRIQALRVSDAIKIDGVLNEPAWSLAQPATDFRQERPVEGDGRE